MKLESMRHKLIKLLTIFIFLTILFLIPRSVSAIIYDLIAPEGPLVRGQNIQFTINIDTEEKAYASTQVGMTYETQYLEYVSVSVGNTFTTVSAETQGEGRLLISASSTPGYSGSGTYAYVTFKLIATSPGSTELCALYIPETLTPTSTPYPTATPGGPTLTPVPTVTPGGPTLTPAPTALPTSGDVSGVGRGLTFGLIFLALAGGGLFVFKNL